MYAVTGLPRSGTSMMMRCIALSSNIPHVVDPEYESKILANELVAGANPNGHWVADLNKKRIAFIGDGAIKCGIIIQHTNATFPINLHSSSDISTISYEAFLKKAFQDLAYTEPFYIKGFHSTQVK